MTAIIRRNPSNSPARGRAEDTLWNWDPFRAMRELVGWSPWTAGETWPAVERSFAPRFDVRETAGEYVFRADLPGVKQEDLEISLTGNQLRIAGHREETKTEESDRNYLAEREYGSFARVFALPEGVDSDKAHADIKDGILTLVVPKKPEAQPRQIPISVPKA